MNGDTRSPAPAAPDPARLRLVIAAAVVLVGVELKLYTGFVWEDFLITFRFSENAAAGKGLVYHAGERVFGFTSPLNGVLPALFKRALGGEGFDRALWCFALVSLFVLAAGLVAFARLLAEEGRSPAPSAQALLTAAFCLLQTKLVVFSVSGQEAGLWAGFLLLALAALARGAGTNWVALGLAWGGVMWTRPDGVVGIALMALAAPFAAGMPVRKTAGGVARALGLCALVYAPWAIFAWAYYGSPIPHTIIAKNNMFGVLPMGEKALRSLDALRMSIPEPFQGTYSGAGGWPAWVGGASWVLGLLCALYWLMPSPDRIGRTASFLYLGCALYLGFVQGSGMIFPWYYAPQCVFGAVVLGSAACRGLAAPRSRAAALACTLAALGLLAYVSLFSAIQLRLRQRLVEDGVRAPLGLWLRSHASPGDRVFLEPIGYIGYYSQLHVLDYPGLITPDVVAIRRATGGGFLQCALLLKPEWLVMRSAEAPYVGSIAPLAAAYAPAVRFDASRALARYRGIPGFGFLEADSSFVVFRRRGPEPAAAPGSP